LPRRKIVEPTKIGEVVSAQGYLLRQARLGHVPVQDAVALVRGYGEIRKSIEYGDKKDLEARVEALEADTHG
jgi:hypothetical protein